MVRGHAQSGCTRRRIDEWWVRVLALLQEEVLPEKEGIKKNLVGLAWNDASPTRFSTESKLSLQVSKYNQIKNEG